MLVETSTALLDIIWLLILKCVKVPFILAYFLSGSGLMKDKESLFIVSLLLGNSLGSVL